MNGLLFLDLISKQARLNATVRAILFFNYAVVFVLNICLFSTLHLLHRVNCRQKQRLAKNSNTTRTCIENFILFQEQNLRAFNRGISKWNQLFSWLKNNGIKNTPLLRKRKKSLYKTKKLSFMQVFHTQNSFSESHFYYCITLSACL